MRLLLIDFHIEEILTFLTPIENKILRKLLEDQMTEEKLGLLLLYNGFNMIFD